MRVLMMDSQIIQSAQEALSYVLRTTRCEHSEREPDFDYCARCKSARALGFLTATLEHGQAEGKAA